MQGELSGDGDVASASLVKFPLRVKGVRALTKPLKRVGSKSEYKRDGGWWKSWIYN